MFVICCDWLCSETNRALLAKSGLQGLYSQLCAVHLCVVPYAWCNIAETRLHDMYHRHQLSCSSNSLWTHRLNETKMSRSNKGYKPLVDREEHAEHSTVQQSTGS